MYNLRLREIKCVFYRKNNLEFNNKNHMIYLLAMTPMKWLRIQQWRRSVLILSAFLGTVILTISIAPSFIRSSERKPSIGEVRAVKGTVIPTTDDITVVTAYFHIERFQKGEGNLFYDPHLYEKWTTTFGYLLNPLVVYTDSSSFESLMKQVRSNLTSKTVIHKIDRNSSWAFQLVDKIRDVYAQPGYPKHHPNTVVPEYACAQHAKYDVMTRAAKRNYYNTNYFQWLDIGCFRELVNVNKTFKLVPPPDFDERKVAMSLVNSLFPSSFTPESIFKGNKLWTGGASFFGKRDVILTYAEQYKRAVDYFLSQGLMNTDQQITLAMFSDQGRIAVKPTVDIQLFHHSGSNWFYLAYLMRKEM